MPRRGRRRVLTNQSQPPLLHPAQARALWPRLPSRSLDLRRSHWATTDCRSTMTLTETERSRLLQASPSLARLRRRSRPPSRPATRRMRNLPSCYGRKRTSRARTTRRSTRLPSRSKPLGAGYPGGVSALCYSIETTGQPMPQWRSPWHRLVSQVGLELCQCEMWWRREIWHQHREEGTGVRRCTRLTACTLS